MKDDVFNAKNILNTWKGDNYKFGYDVIDSIGDFAAEYGKKAHFLSCQDLYGDGRKTIFLR